MIPLHPVHDAGPDERPGWATTRWTLRRGHLVLVPGESPMGLRLPLDALTWRPPPPEPEASTFSERRPLTGRKSAAAKRRPKAKEVEPEKVPRSALCVEARQGNLFVFLPPLEHLEHTVDLLAVVAEAVGRLGRPIVFEGYLPPIDPRLVRMAVTPDPGVIEVNIHPAASWSELVEITTGVHDEARATRLATEKFDLDGTHAGTGGGNHLTLGGPTPADSPLLRRPELLRSLHHLLAAPPVALLPVLRPVHRPDQPGAPGRRGPPRQPLRARDRLRRARPPDGGHRPRPPPWLVDRLLRHLLVDVTGNTHRAEFCIDKLFNPESRAGPARPARAARLRDAAPPPDGSRAGAAGPRPRRPLLGTSRIAGPLVRWGTELHDRFMLPCFVEADIAEVVDDLDVTGSASTSPGWTRSSSSGSRGSVRSTWPASPSSCAPAIEPWHVLGEEVASAGTARYVDSSVERLQLHDGRADATAGTRDVQRRAVPLHPTGTAGTLVAGVRYRAW